MDWLVLVNRLILKAKISSLCIFFVSKNADKLPRLFVAGLGGSSGKTFISLGLCSIFAQNGLKVQPYKKGPDYIDANWLSNAAGLAAINLDPFLFPAKDILPLFVQHMQGKNLGLIEGNRGLFDGMDIEGSCSSAEIARMLQAPVVLVVDCTKVTRTVAAMVLGCRQFEPDLNLAGVILNRTAGERHRQILRNCIERYTDVPVLGTLPKKSKNPIPERYMGLVSNREQVDNEKIFLSLAEMLKDNVDIDAVQQIAFSAPPLSIDWSQYSVKKSDEVSNFSQDKKTEKNEAANKNFIQQNFSAKVRIGVASDKAFCFYYQDNLLALETAGAELVSVSLLDTKPWQEIDGLYLGGGFPEILAAQLEENVQIRQGVKELAEKGLPIYAECGGLIYLGENIVSQGKTYIMSGVLPLCTTLHARPQGHGYVQVRVSSLNPYFSVGQEINGHEFHYSSCEIVGVKDLSQTATQFTYGFEMLRGTGISNKFDGLVYKNVFAAYTHLHVLGIPCWADNFVRAARIFHQNPVSCSDIRLEN